MCLGQHAGFAGSARAGRDAAPLPLEVSVRADAMAPHTGRPRDPRTQDRAVRVAPQVSPVAAWLYGAAVGWGTVVEPHLAQLYQDADARRARRRRSADPPPECRAAAP